MPGSGVRERVRAYLAALLVAAVAYLCRRALDPVLVAHAPFVTFYLGVVLVGWRWGAGPGGVVAVLGALLVQWTYFFQNRPAEVVWLVFYLLACATILAALEALERARSVAQERLDRLQREVEERERAQRAEEIQKRWAAATLASIGDAVMATDREGRVTFLNGVAERLTGWTTEQAVGRPVAEVFVIRNEDTQRPTEIPVEKVLREGRAVGLANHTELVARDGRVIPIDDSAAPIHDAAGELLGVVLVFRDIGERRRAEQALVRSNAELERFAYVASHDLQEPLRTVASFVGLLERKYREALDDDARQYITFAVDGARRMQEMVRDLLEYSRAGSQSLRMEAVELDAVLDRVIAGLREPIAEGQATIEREPLPVVVGDPARLGQVFQNLLANALKFRGDRPARISVRARPSGEHWEIEVRDDGIGFDPRDRDRIFVMFQRLHRRDEIPGTGIGLAICKRIVEAHGGTIAAEGASGGGACFRFTLPGAGERPQALAGQEAERT